MRSQDEAAEYHDDIPVRKSRSPKRIIGLFFIALSAVGFTVAANISIGAGNKIEFGQGIYRVTSCDQWIGIKLNPSPASYGGQSRVANMSFNGFDALNCRGVDVKIQLLDSSSGILPIFTDTATLTVDRVILNVSSDVTKTRANAVGFYNGYGALVTSSLSGSNGYAYDGYQYLSYNSNTGVYTMVFNYPLATMSAVNSLTVQSVSAP